jgi:hypothetical protein
MGVHSGIMIFALYSQNLKSQVTTIDTVSLQSRPIRSIGPLTILFYVLPLTAHPLHHYSVHNYAHARDILIHGTFHMQPESLCEG